MSNVKPGAGKLPKDLADVDSDAGAGGYGLRQPKPKNVLVLNEFEKHEGWKQIARKEKHKMITSIKRSIHENETYDHERAHRILKA